MSQTSPSRNPPRSAPETVALPAFADNYLWLISRDGHAVVVDPGDAGPVRDAIRERELKLDAILLTHHHPDHIGGVSELVSCTDARVYAPHDSRIAHADRRVADGDTVSLPTLGLRFRVWATPGHTLSHIVYFDDTHLFCGDTLFSLGCGRLFEGTPAQMLASLDRLSALPDATRVFCAHEYTLDNARFALTVDPNNPALQQRVLEATRLRQQDRPTLPIALASEKACNPFLRIDSAGVQAGLRGRVAAGADRGSRFAALRAWKDTFRG